MHLTHLLHIRQVRLRLLHFIGYQALLTLFLLAGFCLPTQAQCTIEFVAEFPGIVPFGLGTNLASDPAGNVYYADAANNRIVKISSTGAFISAFGNFGTGNGEFDFPVGVAVDSNGNIYVTDFLNNRIQKFDSNGTHIFTVGGLAAGPAPGEFSGPTLIAVDSNGNIFVSDTGNGRIQKFNTNGGFLTQWNVTTPAGIAVDSQGNVIVFDQASLFVLKFTNNGTLITQWGGPGVGNGQFGAVVPGGGIGVAVDSNDNVYVVDSGNSRVQKFTNNGTYLTQWGTPGNGPGQFNNPFGIVVDTSGNVYVSDPDPLNMRIQKFRQICGAGGPSDQRPGSVLVFPYYTSNSVTKADTRLTISNVGTQSVSVHIFFIDGTSCNQADQFLCLTPNASFAFKASEYDPEATGYLLAVAVDAEGRPVRNNSLIGNAFVNEGDYVDNYGATGFWASFPNVATLNANGTATLNFDGSGYDRVPNQFAVELQSPLDAVGQRIVTASLQGDLTTGSMTGASQVGTGLVYNGNEKPFGSFSGFLKGTCQAIATISTTNPRVPNGLGAVIPKGQVGSMKITTGPAVGLIMTPRTATWKGIRGLHVLGTTNATITIPTIRPVC